MLEVTASDSNASIESHIEQCEAYAGTVWAKQAVLVNFFVSNTPNQIVNKHRHSAFVNVIYVQHDLEWTHATVYYEDKVHEIDL